MEILTTVSTHDQRVHSFIRINGLNIIYCIVGSNEVNPVGGLFDNQVGSDFLIIPIELLFE